MNKIREQKMRIEVRNPFNNRLEGIVYKSSQEEILRAVDKAQSAFKKHKKTSAFRRQQILKEAHGLLCKNKNSIARLITRETGKPIKESFREIERALFVLEQSAQEALRIYGEVLPCDVTSSQVDKIAIALRKPLGVVAAITPFNFPLNTLVHKVAPALAAGNSVVVKPSPLAPLTAVRFAKIMKSAGLPEDMLLVVQGFKEEAQILAAAGVNVVTFTGSTVGGKDISAAAGMKKVMLELGGNSPLIVFDDADIQAAVKTCVEERFGLAGQRCTAVKQLFLHTEVYKKFISLFLKEAGRLKIGNPMDKHCDLGPLITESAAVLVENRIKEVIRKGGRLIWGGKRVKNFIYPTILENIPQGCELIEKETFGPVVPVFKFKNIEEVIDRVNKSVYGLQAGVYTNRLDFIKRLGEELSVGTLIVNGGPGFRIESLPFGGVKDSGLGREGIRYAIEEMTEIVTLVL